MFELSYEYVEDEDVCFCSFQYKEQGYIQTSSITLYGIQHYDNELDFSEVKYCFGPVFRI